MENPAKRPQLKVIDVALEDFTSKLRSYPREAAELVALRAALRAFPHYAELQSDFFETGDPPALTTALRILLTSCAYLLGNERSLAPALERSITTPSAFIGCPAKTAIAAAGQALLDGYAEDAAKAVDRAAWSAGGNRSGIAPEVAVRDETFLQSASQDLVWFASGIDLRASGLWSGPPPDLWSSAADRAIQNLTRETGDPNSFWHRWWRGAVSGEWLDWNLQREVALIPDAIWQQGPKAVAAAIAEIEARYTPRYDLHEELAKLPRPAQQVVVAVQQAMQHNREALPPTFDAIQGLIALEIERLLKRNYTDDLDQQECQRQISVYLALYDAVCALRDNLPTAGPVTLEQAATSEGLLQLYWNKIKQLPREKADEVVEGIWGTAKGAMKLGLIGTSIAMANSYGIRPDVAAALAGLVFAPKNVGDVINAARGLASKP